MTKERIFRKAILLLLPFSLLLSSCDGSSSSLPKQNGNDASRLKINKKDFPDIDFEDHELKPVDIPISDVPIPSVQVLIVPTQEVEIGYIAYMGIEVKMEYEDGTTASFPFTERLLTKDSYDKLKTPGKKSIDFLLQDNHVSFDITLR